MPADLTKLEELLRNKMSEYFGEKIREIKSSHGDLMMTVDREAIVEVCTKLRDDHDFRFDFLAYCTVVDYSALGRTPRYEAIYQLYSTRKTHRLRVKAQIPEDDPSIDSVVPVWGGANWMEREAFDMFGVIFRNHPDLRRILLPEDWEGHPLRKDFPLGGVKSFYFKRSTEPRAGEPKNLVPRIREQKSDI